MTGKSGPLGIFFSLLFFSLTASAAPGQQAVVLPELSSFSLLNGLQAFVAATPHLGNSMTIGLVLRYGSTFDPANKGGLAYLTSRLFAKATLDRSAKDIQDELNYLHASFEVDCEWDGIRFLIHGETGTYERCLLLLYQIVCEAKFNDEDFDQTKTALIRQLQAPEDPRQQMRHRFDAELFRGTTYGRPLQGTLDSVRNIAVGDVRYFYHRCFSPDHASLVITGNVPASTVLGKVRRIWGVWVRNDEIPFTFLPPRTPAGRNIFLEDDPASPAAQYIMGNLGSRREDPQYYADTVALRFLQARLNQALPTSRVTAADESRMLPGPFYIQGQAAADQAIGEIAKIMDAVDSFKDSLVSAEEATKARDQWIEEFSKAIGSTDGICRALLDAELYRLGVNYLAIFPDFVRRSDPSMIRDAAKRSFFPNGLILIVRGPADILQPQLEVLGPVQLIKR
jgi:zinc protease